MQIFVPCSEKNFKNRCKDNTKTTFVFFQKYFFQKNLLFSANMPTFLRVLQIF